MSSQLENRQQENDGVIDSECDINTSCIINHKRDRRGVRALSVIVLG